MWFLLSGVPVVGTLLLMLRDRPKNTDFLSYFAFLGLAVASGACSNGIDKGASVPLMYLVQAVLFAGAIGVDRWAGTEHR